MELADWYEEFNQRRLNAFSSQDALKYFDLCLELGIKPENKDLFDLGEVQAYFDSEYLNKNPWNSAWGREPYGDDSDIAYLYDDDNPSARFPQIDYFICDVLLALKGKAS